MDLGDVFDLLVTPSDWIENWTSWAKFLLFAAGVGLIVLGAMESLKPTPAWVGFAGGAILILSSVLWTISDRRS